MFKKQKKQNQKQQMQKNKYTFICGCFLFSVFFAFVSFFPFAGSRWKLLGAHISYSDPAPKRDITRYTRVGVSE